MKSKVSSYNMDELKSSLKNEINPEIHSNNISQNTTKKLNNDIQIKVEKLEELQTQHNIILKQTQEEIQAIKKKYEIESGKIAELRRKIVVGEHDNPISSNEQNLETTSGIPRFWLTVLQSCEALTEAITKHDVPILMTLKDIRIRSFESNSTELSKKDNDKNSKELYGYQIIFEFGPNKFMENEILTKTYYLAKTDDIETLEFHSSEGTIIKWKYDNNPTISKSKTDKNQYNDILSDTPSFFDFFESPDLKHLNIDEKALESKSSSSSEHSDESSGSNTAELYELIGIDFEFGEIFRTQIFPYAIDWFTGKRLCYYKKEHKHSKHNTQNETSSEESNDNFDTSENDHTDVTSSLSISSFLE